MKLVNDLAIEAVGLGKSYGGTPVLHQVDLAVPRGSVYAALGLAGAGKTTVVRILSTLIRPDTGRARVMGFDVVADRHQVQRTISLVGPNAALDALQTGEENLRTLGRRGRLSSRGARRRAAELLELSGLGSAAKQLAGTYSQEMWRRLDLAAGLVVQPAVICLDEPTAGLAPDARRVVWQALRDVADSGCTVFLTTRDADEAERLADRVGIMGGGRMLSEGSVQELKRRTAGRYLEITVTDGLAYRHVCDWLRSDALGGEVPGCDPRTRTIALATDGSATHVRTLLDLIDPLRTLVKDFAVRSTTLQDALVGLTGRTAPVASWRRTAPL